MTTETLTELERDTLQEIMNVGFGAAAADIAEIIDIYVVLSVPVISVLNTPHLLDYIKSEVGDYTNVHIIEQNFWSKFKGVALLVFSVGAGKGMLSVLGRDVHRTLVDTDPLGVLEDEALLEVGNILAGACVGKIAELLGDVVSYSPPRSIVGSLTDAAVSRDMFNPQNVVIVLQTVFHFDSSKSVKGNLFLITSHDSIAWLKQALQTFLKQYE